MIRIELIEEEDFNKVIEWNLDKTSDFLLQWAGESYKYPLTLEQIKEHYYNNIKNNVHDMYKIIWNDNNKIIGTVELAERDKENKMGRVSRFLIGDERYRGNGLGTEVLKKITQIGFEKFSFDKITLGVFEHNIGAIKCYEKAGFKKQKLIEKAKKGSDGYWNLFEMEILR